MFHQTKTPHLSFSTHFWLKTNVPSCESKVCPPSRSVHLQTSQRKHSRWKKKPSALSLSITYTRLAQKWQVSLPPSPGGKSLRGTHWEEEEQGYRSRLHGSLREMPAVRNTTYVSGQAVIFFFLKDVKLWQRSQSAVKTCSFPFYLKLSFDMRMVSSSYLTLSIAAYFTQRPNQRFSQYTSTG